MTDNSADKSKTATREERLAAKLRENLRRRKAQSRAIGGQEDEARDHASPLSNSALPNKDGAG